MRIEIPDESIPTVRESLKRSIHKLTSINQKGGKSPGAIASNERKIERLEQVLASFDEQKEE